MSLQNHGWTGYNGYAYTVTAENYFAQKVISHVMVVILCLLCIMLQYILCHDSM